MIDRWFTKAFKHKPFDDYYIREWYSRFDTPKRVWSLSDFERRESLIKEFPKVFGGLDKNDNLNNPEYNNRFNRW